MVFHPNRRNDVYSARQVVQILKRKGISTVYTGKIPFKSEFLGLPYECDEEYPIVRTALEDSDIERFESEGMKVVKLDHLI